MGWRAAWIDVRLVCAIAETGQTTHKEIIGDTQADIKSDSSRYNDSEMLRSVGKALEK